ncbi:YbaB/EbfC family nucleoid-associated protein [Occultella gossypii]|uniref:YbaB/EbfC family nucleoid-associated protein n=1 Tax=Occultella gossypii TaxID=2800820 RepID=A0ABS7S8E7_9MICO|nr:YbaB/EbfC family nucleoid-associated protein [Occultella gossypii]MBZ2196505.1 YbaB/EbfC family nucleoid-associated protein [Occultella gossypii]
MTQDPAAILAQLDQIRAGAEQRGRAAQRATQRMQAIRVEAYSPRREVRVVLGASGLVEDVEYSHAAPTSSPLALARAFQRAHDDAIEKWSEAMDAINDEEFAGDPVLHSAMRTAAHESLPPRLSEPPE